LVSQETLLLDHLCPLSPAVGCRLPLPATIILSSEVRTRCASRNITKSQWSSDQKLHNVPPHIDCCQLFTRRMCPTHCLLNVGITQDHHCSSVGVFYEHFCSCPPGLLHLEIKALSLHSLGFFPLSSNMFVALSLEWPLLILLLPFLFVRLLLVTKLN